MINLQAIWERCRRVLSSLAAYFTGAWPLLAITLFIQALSAQVVQGTLDSVTNATCEIAGWARDPTNPAPPATSTLLLLQNPLNSCLPGA